MERYNKTFNFAAGPAPLPGSVLAKARAELYDWQGQGYSILETPFSSDRFAELMVQAKMRLRALLNLPPGYQILFLQGGASAQFSLIPLNLLPASGKAGYVDTGHWSARALQEGARYGKAHTVASSRSTGYDRIPSPHRWSLPQDLSYCHITTNETANGVQFHADPDCDDVPLVADMTSEFLSRPININQYGLIYAGTQKNLGPAGLVVVIIRETLLGRARPETPRVFNYESQIEAGNRTNTPLMFAIYLVDLMLEWLDAQGGLPAIQIHNKHQSEQVYSVIDQDDFYHCPAQPGHRSVMNLCFGLASESLRQTFLDEASERGLCNLSGHSHAGGLRASLYNAQTDAAVGALIDFMRDFRNRYG